MKSSRALVLYLLLVIFLSVCGFSKAEKYSKEMQNGGRKAKISGFEAAGINLTEMLSGIFKKTAEELYESNKKMIREMYEEATISIVEENRESIMDFFVNFPLDRPYKWFEIYHFDFNRDGQLEIILSKSYVKDPGGFQYSYVYDLEGNKQFEYILTNSPGVYDHKSSLLPDTPCVYDDEENNVFYLFSNGSVHHPRNYIGVYWEISGSDTLEASLVYLEWEWGVKNNPNYTYSCSIFTDTTEEEISVIANGSYGEVMEMLENKEKEDKEEELELYRQRIVSLPSKEWVRKGTISYNDNEIVLKNEDKDIIYLVGTLEERGTPWSTLP